MKPKRVVLIGGSGFLGHAIANKFSQAGVSVVVPTRRRERARHLLLLPTVEVVQADVHDDAALTPLLRGADAVVNLVGVLHSRPGTPYGPDFARAHVELPRTIATATRAAGVERLVHISALGADPQGPSEYQRSKAGGEAAIRATEGVAWTILRPSVVFGREDSFLNLFAQLVRLFPVLPLAGAHTRFQPVFVEDVAEVVWQSVHDASATGKTWDLAGPTVYTLRELVDYVAELLGKRRVIIPLPESVALVQARLMEFAPNPLMSRDNVRSMRADNVTQADTPLPLGLTPTALESIAPGYIANKTLRGRYYPLRCRAHRDAG